MDELTENDTEISTHTVYGGKREWNGCCRAALEITVHLLANHCCLLFLFSRFFSVVSHGRPYFVVGSKPTLGHGHWRMVSSRKPKDRRCWTRTESAIIIEHGECNGFRANKRDSGLFVDLFMPHASATKRKVHTLTVWSAMVIRIATPSTRWMCSVH